MALIYLDIVISWILSRRLQVLGPRVAWRLLEEHLDPFAGLAATGHDGHAAEAAVPVHQELQLLSGGSMDEND